MSDQLKVMGVTLGSITLSLTQVNTMIQIAAGLTALCYSLCKWRRAYLRNKNRK